jgi:aminoglycoside phosphotransferase (APT) family kinase protein
MPSLTLRARPEVAAPQAPAPSIHPLRGHSGARVAYHAAGKRGFVRKTAAEPAANERLMAQAEKQRQLHMLALPFPRVLSQGMDAQGCATFDMEYLPGRSVADAVINAAFFDTATLVRTVQRMTWLFAHGTGAALPVRLFQGKIESIAAACDDDAIRASAARLLALDWNGIPMSPCHGDLTLENILLTTGSTVGLIDCDETFASSWWLDFGKLFQDIEGHWCLRGLYAPDVPAVRRINAVQKLEGLGTAFRTLAARCDPALPARLPQLAALGLLRAAPYARNQATRDFVCARIARLLEGRP